MCIRDSYDTITIEADQSGFQPCQDLIVIEGVSLNEGANLSLIHIFRHRLL